MIDAPCKGCEERHVGCHSKCEKYSAFLERRSAIKLKAAGLGMMWEYDCDKAQRYFKIRNKAKGK